MGKDISFRDLAFNFTYAVTCVFIAKLIAGLFANFGGNAFLDFVGTFLGSEYIWITTISVLVATLMPSQVEELHGSQEIGTFFIYLFLFVIGVPANIWTVITKAPLFLVLCFIMVAFNMLFCFIGAKACKGSLEEAILASNANIGGGTTAAGMGISLGWSELIGPAILVGTLGNVIGNYAGLMLYMIIL